MVWGAGKKRRSGEDLRTALEVPRRPNGEPATRQLASLGPQPKLEHFERHACSQPRAGLTSTPLENSFRIEVLPAQPIDIRPGRLKGRDATTEGVAGWLSHAMADFQGNQRPRRASLPTGANPTSTCSLNTHRLRHREPHPTSPYPTL